MALAGPVPNETLPGRWYPREYRKPDTEGLSDADKAEVERLEALGYLTGYDLAATAVGVVLWTPGQSDPGRNLVASGHAPEAQLLGMDGRVLHRWTAPFDLAFPGYEVVDKQASGAFRSVTLRPADGHLLAIYEGLGIVHLDAGSAVVWASANRAHHAAHWLPNGGVLTLTRALRGSTPEGGPAYEDFVSELDERGREVRRVSVHQAIARSRWAGLLQGAGPDPGDRLHTNALFPLDDIPTDKVGISGRGRVLLSMRHIDALAVLDLDEARIVWLSQGPWSRQHDVQITASGAMLLFDNRGGRHGTSRAVALEPFTDRALWQYAGEPGLPLSSDVLGAVQELPNGNVLITESTAGRVVEVTRAGDPVWVWTNPAVTGPDDRWVAAVFHVTRFPHSVSMPWLADPGW